MPGLDDNTSISSPDFDMSAAVDAIADGLPELAPNDTGPGDGEQGAEGDAAGENASEGSGAPAKASGRDAPAAAGAKPAAPAGGDSPAAPAQSEDKAPDTWRKEAKEAWANLPPVIKEEFRKREGDMATFVNQYRQQAEVGNQILQRVQANVPLYQQRGIDPGKLVPALIESHRLLTFGTPEEKVGVITMMAQSAGIDLRAMAAGQPQDAARTQGAQLMQRIAQLENQTRTALTAHQQRQMSEMTETVNKFADAKDAEGNLVHPYFDEVGLEMQQLVKTGVAKTLEEAYEKAVHLNPVTRQKELDRLADLKAAEKAKALAEKTAKARRAAGGNVRSTGSGSRGAPAGNWEDDLKNIAAEIESRDS